MSNVIVSNVHYDEPADCYVCGGDMDDTDGFQVVQMTSTTVRLLDVCSERCVTEATS